MKKYIVSILLVSTILISSPLSINKASASASDMSIRDIIYLLINIGVITPAQMPTVNAFLLNLDNSQVINTQSSLPFEIIQPVNGRTYKPGESVDVRWKINKFSGKELYLSFVNKDNTLACDYSEVVSPYLRNGVPSSNPQEFGTILYIGSPKDPGGTCKLKPGQYKISLCENNLDSSTLKDNNCAFSPLFSVVPDTVNSVETAFGIIKGINIEGSNAYIDIDYITMNSNWKPGGRSGAPYTNTNPRIRRFKVTDDIKVFGSAPDHFQFSFKEFFSIFTSDYSGDYRRSNPWKIKVSNGVVVEATEYFLP